MRRFALAPVAMLLVLLVPAIATACPRTSLGAVEHEVMCLECGVPLDEATNSIQAERERAFIVGLVLSDRVGEQGEQRDRGGDRSERDRSDHALHRSAKGREATRSGRPDEGIASRDTRAG